MRGSMVENIALMAHKEGTCNSTPLATGWVDTAQLGICMAVLMMDNMANETIDFKVQQSAAANGSSPKDLKAATQLAASATANDYGAVKITFRPEELDVSNGFRYVNATAVTGNTVGGTAAVSILATARYSAVSSVEPVTVLQTKL